MEGKMHFIGQAPIEIVLDVGTHFAVYKFVEAVPKAEPLQQEPVESGLGQAAEQKNPMGVVEEVVPLQYAGDEPNGHESEYQSVNLTDEEEMTLQNIKNRINGGEKLRYQDVVSETKSPKKAAKLWKIMKGGKQ